MAASYSQVFILDNVSVSSVRGVASPGYLPGVSASPGELAGDGEAPPLGGTLKLSHSTVCSHGAGVMILGAFRGGSSQI